MGQMNAIQSSHESFALDALRCFKDVDLFSRSRTCVYLSGYYIRSGEAQKALDLCKDALHLAEEAGDLAQVAEVLVRLSQMHLQLGNSCLGLKYAREGCRKAKSAGSMLVEARAIRQYAYCCVSVGDYARSTTLCAEARVVLDTLGMCDVRNAIHRNFLDLQAQTHQLQTYYALSRQLNAALIGVPRDQRTEEKVSEAYARINVASSDIRMGRCTDPSVRRNIDVARGPMAGTSNRLGLPTCDFALADLYFHQGNYREWGSLYEQCLPIIDIQGQSAELELVCREKLADIAFAENDTRRAEQLSFVLLILALRVRNSAATHQALRRIGDIFRSAGDFGTAETLFELALSGFTLMDIHQARRDCLIRLGDIHQMRGEGERATTEWSQARFI